MKSDFRSFGKLQDALIARLTTTWREQSSPIYEAIAEACRNHDWDEARRLVPELDLTEVGTQNREWIKYMLLAFAIHGANTVAGRQPSFIGVGSFDTLLNQVTSNVLQYLEMTATAQIQAQARQLIAQDQATATANKIFKYGNTQIDIDPKSEAAQSLNALRDQIDDQDLMSHGKDDSNHVTVRYGIDSMAVDGLRAYIAGLSPFTAELSGLEVFEPGTHSQGAYPLVARVESPELHFIHHEISKHGDFIEPTFPDYKPHATIAYVKPEAVEKYKNLSPSGKFLVDSITLSHKNGVQETVPFGIKVQAKKDDISEADLGVAGKVNPEIAGGKKKKKKIIKFNPNHDALGRFAPAQGEVFASPNEAENLSFEEAAQNLQSGRQKEMEQMARDVMAQIDHGGEVHSAIGDWSDGAENSMVVMPHSRDQLQVEYMAAVLGDEANQKAVIPFVPDHKGKDSVWSFEVPSTPGETRTALDKLGVAFRTLEPTTHGTHVYVFDPGSQLKDTMEKVGEHYGQQIGRIKGNGSFLGGDTREEGRDAYHRVFSEYEKHGQPYKRSDGTIYRSGHHHHGGLETVAKADENGRYVTPFVSFSNQGDDKLQLIASLNASRLAVWGFVAEADVRGINKYQVNEIDDARECDFCNFINGKEFDVEDARQLVNTALQAQDPEDLRTIQPWPKQTAAAMKEYRAMSADDLIGEGLHIPPYHPNCRGTLMLVGQYQTGPAPYQAPEEDQSLGRQTITLDTLRELGLTNVTQDDVDHWNQYVGLSPMDILAKLSGKQPNEILEGAVGKEPISFEDNGNVAFNLNGKDNGVNYFTSTVLNPYSKEVFIAEQELEEGGLREEEGFLAKMYKNTSDFTKQVGEESISVSVPEGMAIFYIKMGFLPEESEWDTIREEAQDLLKDELEEFYNTMLPSDRMVLDHVLASHSPKAVLLLVDSDFSYEGKTLAEWFLEDVTGIFRMDMSLGDRLDMIAEEFDGH